MATDRNVYELVDEYTALGQNMKNVYYYQIGTGLSFNAQNLVDDWIANVLPDILSVQTADITHTRVSARNLFNDAETGETLHSLTGTHAGMGDRLSPFTAFGFTLARQSASTRSGKKRVYAGGEGVVNGTSISDGSYLTELLDLATTFAANIVVTLVTRWFPVIVKRILSGDSYRLPESQAEATVNGVDSGLVSSLVTTQNSRKVGVGE